MELEYACSALPQATPMIIRYFLLNLQNFVPALTKRSRFEAIQWKYDVSGR